MREGDGGVLAGLLFPENFLFLFLLPSNRGKCSKGDARLSRPPLFNFDVISFSPPSVTN